MFSKLRSIKVSTSRLIETNTLRLRTYQWTRKPLGQQQAGNDWNEAFSIFNGTTLILKKCLSAVFASFCVPNSFVSDKGSEFPCHHFKACCKSQKTIRTESLIYHPQSNGQKKRAIWTVIHALKFRAKTFQSQSLGFCNNWMGCTEALLKQQVKAHA